MSNHFGASRLKPKKTCNYVHPHPLHIETWTPKMLGRASWCPLNTLRFQRAPVSLETFRGFRRSRQPLRVGEASLPCGRLLCPRRPPPLAPCYCRTTLKPWLKPQFVGVYRGIIIPGFLSRCRISSIHSRKQLCRVELDPPHN